MPDIEKIRGLSHNARGGLVVRGIGAATYLCPNEPMCRDWAHGLRGWRSRDLGRQADRWARRAGVWGKRKKLTRKEHEHAAL